MTNRPMRERSTMEARSPRRKVYSDHTGCGGVRAQGKARTPRVFICSKCGRPLSGTTKKP